MSRCRLASILSCLLASLLAGQGDSFIVRIPREPLPCVAVWKGLTTDLHRIENADSSSRLKFAPGQLVAQIPNQFARNMAPQHLDAPQRLWVEVLSDDRCVLIALRDMMSVGPTLAVGVLAREGDSWRQTHWGELASVDQAGQVLGFPFADLAVASMDPVSRSLGLLVENRQNAPELANRFQISSPGSIFACSLSLAEYPKELQTLRTGRRETSVIGTLKAPGASPRVLRFRDGEVVVTTGDVRRATSDDVAKPPPPSAKTILVAWRPGEDGAWTRLAMPELEVNHMFTVATVNEHLIVQSIFERNGVACVRTANWDRVTGAVETEVTELGHVLADLNQFLWVPSARGHSLWVVTSTKDVVRLVE